MNRTSIKTSYALRGVNRLPALLTEIRVALASHPTVRIAHPRPKKLARELQVELPVCDVRVARGEVLISWKVVESPRSCTLCGASIPADALPAVCGRCIAERGP
jgi:hypothetical protein